MDPIDRVETPWNTYQPGSCPDCGAQYPDFYSPKGELGAFCDRCGYEYKALVDGPH